MIRGGAGLVYDVGMNPAAFPMQADGDLGVHGHGFTFVGLVGLQQGHDVTTVPVSREHWVMWQPEQGASDGLYLRAGRFMPVYGLRFAEHTAYTRRYGGTPLYGETYGAAVEYVKPAYELHVTGFVHDPSSTPPSTATAPRATARSGSRAWPRSAPKAATRRATRTAGAGGLTAKLWLDPI